MQPEAVKKEILSRGYWEVVLKPQNFSNSFELQKLKDILVENHVELRGWSYPFLPKDNPTNQSVSFGNDFVEGFVNWNPYKENWRFFKSGQFVHYFSAIEDWMKDSDFYKDRAAEAENTLSVFHALYCVAEIFEFTRRLASVGVFDEGISISVKLDGMKGRKLIVNEPDRTGLWHSYICQINTISIAREYSKDEFLEKSKDFALYFVKELFLRFGWENQPTSTFENDQLKLLSGKLI